MYLVLRECTIQLKTQLEMKYQCYSVEVDRHEHLFDVEIKTPIEYINLDNSEIELISYMTVKQRCPLAWFFKLELI